jgi:purine nucleoside permease
MSGSQDYELDPRNASIRVYVNGELCPRDQAKVSIFYPGQAVSEALIDYAQQGGFAPAISNLFGAGVPWVRDVVERWSEWRGGVPE